MSHYSLMVKISSAFNVQSSEIYDVVSSFMSPYQGAVGCHGEGCLKKHLEFYDIEEEFLKNYFNDVFSGEWLEIEHPEKIGKSPCEVWDTFESYMENWIGYTCRDSEKGRFGYWENPNRKISS